MQLAGLVFRASEARTGVSMVLLALLWLRRLGSTRSARLAKRRASRRLRRRSLALEEGAQDRSGTDGGDSRPPTGSASLRVALLKAAQRLKGVTRHPAILA